MMRDEKTTATGVSKYIRLSYMDMATAVVSSHPVGSRPGTVWFREMSTFHAADQGHRDDK